jgi:hypothetical protein
MTGKPHLPRAASDRIAPRIDAFLSVVARRTSAEVAAMRDYAILKPQFWYGETARRLRDNREARLLAVYLISCPTSNMTGLFYLPLALMACETTIPLDEVCKALRSLSEAGFAFYDDQQQMVWVPEMARHQIGERLSPGDKRIKGVLRTIERYRTHPYYAEFMERYREPFHLESEEKAKPLRCQDQDQDQEQDQDQTRKKIVAPASLSRRPREGSNLEVSEKSTRVDPGSEPSGVEDERGAGADAAPRKRAPLPFTPDEAVRALSEASNSRFVASKLQKGQAINVQKLIRQHPDLAEWRLVGEWLGAGGEAWRSELDSRHLRSFEQWLAHATRWHEQGRPAVAARPSRATPAAVGYSPATTVYERSEDLTDRL